MLNDISNKLVQFVNSKFPNNLLSCEPNILFENNFLSILNSLETKKETENINFEIIPSKRAKSIDTMKIKNFEIEILNKKKESKLSIATNKSFLINTHEEILKRKNNLNQTQFDHSYIKEKNLNFIKDRFSFEIEKIAPTIPKIPNNFKKIFRCNSSKKIKILRNERKEVSRETSIEILKDISKNITTLPVVKTDNSISSLSDFKNIFKKVDDIDDEYDRLKKSIYDMRPILVKDDKAREDFFVKLSEGDHSKYIFFKNLYQLVSNTNTSNKLNKSMNLSTQYVKASQYDNRNFSFSLKNKFDDKYKKDCNININIQNPEFKILEIDYKNNNEKIILKNLPNIK